VTQVTVALHTGPLVSYHRNGHRHKPGVKMGDKGRWEARVRQSGSQWYELEVGALGASSTGRYRYRSAGGKLSPLRKKGAYGSH